MSRMAMFVCDICGKRSGERNGWFVVSGQGARLEIASWNEDIAAVAGARHACSPAHVEKLVLASLSPELRRPLVALPVRHGGWNPAALETKQLDPANAEDALLSILEAIDVALQSPTREEDEVAAFDA